MRLNDRARTWLPWLLLGAAVVITAIVYWPGVIGGWVDRHKPVLRYVEPATFSLWEAEAAKLGFMHAAVGPMVRSSYHADQQAHEAGVPGAG